jgi:hypothetical protein
MKQILLLAMLCLAACATTENYEKVLSSWVGSGEDSLIASWGPPDSSYQSGETKYLTYARSNTSYVPGVAPTYQTTCSFGICRTTPIGGSPGYAVNSNCKTTFTVVGSKITNWRWQGNDCTA